MSLLNKTTGLFNRFVEVVAKADFKAAAMIPAAIGIATVMGGCAWEAHSQTELLMQGGSAALDAYKASLDLGLDMKEWLSAGVQGKLPSVGGNIQAAGFALTFLGSAMAVTTVGLAKGYERIKETLTEKSQTLLQSGLNLIGSKETPPASRHLSPDSLKAAIEKIRESLPEQKNQNSSWFNKMNKGFKSIKNKLEEVRDQRVMKFMESRPDLSSKLMLNMNLERKQDGSGIAQRVDSRMPILPPSKQAEIKAAIDQRDLRHSPTATAGYSM
ncbi:hypothetical protein [Vogesella sp. XCS3]|uniref:hypothetical protein n=1 Tax=Vogesella sp. XCS3 TaxID=2877939 RepID=UPI001D0B5438|nr:hypothetical protein [Vogesella sp. XCS3]UDM18888.1 hypothetical protein LCH97_18635 [Vogesella sp. XCS3]